MQTELELKHKERINIESAETQYEKKLASHLARMETLESEAEGFSHMLEVRISFCHAKRYTHATWLFHLYLGAYRTSNHHL